MTPVVDTSAQARNLGKARRRVGKMDLLSRSTHRHNAIAIVAEEGTYTFETLTLAAQQVASALLDGRNDLDEKRVAFLVSPGYRYTAVLLGIWAAGGVAVPLATSHPAAELRHVVEDADASFIVCGTEFRDRLEPIAEARALELIDADEIVFGSNLMLELPVVDSARRALILYTSGSTGPPKGVVWTHHSVQAQLRILSEAWEWTENDRALLVLPLHHVHGLINVLGCSLWNAATCEILPAFDADEALARLAHGEVTIFMAVPTIFRRLIAAWEALETSDRDRVTAVLRTLRLMVSGSAALPVPTLERWQEVAGHTLLERYGMTEIGMALSNPYRGARTPGSVGRPLPTVEVRLVDSVGKPVVRGTQGEIEVKGPSVFAEYWRLPETTAASFHQDWFRTGDVAIVEENKYRILGRQSVDIIKSGAEKVSALEVEDVLRTHVEVKDCAVVGLPDNDWGERVVVAIVPTGKTRPSLDDLQDFARPLLAPYKLPRQLLVLDALPRNAMGKVVKPRLKELFSKSIIPKS